MERLPGDIENELLQAFVEAFGSCGCRITDRCDSSHYAEWENLVGIRVPEHGRHLVIEVKTGPYQRTVIEVPRSK